MCEALTYLLDNIFISSVLSYTDKLLDIPMGTNYAPLIDDVFFFFAMKEILWPLFLIIESLSYKK